jgi:SNF2 family DNA or RNA helicase
MVACSLTNGNNPRENMALTMEVTGRVSAGVRDKGTSYYHGGRVKILYGDEHRVRAEVRGTELYDVIISRSAKTLKVGCTCPYFDSNESVCKHIYATLLAAEAKNNLTGDAGRAARGKLKIVIDTDLLDNELDDAEDDDFDEFGDEFSDDEAGYRDEWRQPPAPRRSPQKKRGKSRRASWKQQLARVDRTMSERASLGRSHWPPGREILYIVDRQATLQGKGLILEVGHRERKQNGDWSKPKFERIDAEDIARLADPADRQSLAILCGADPINGYYNGGYGYSPGACRFTVAETLFEPLFPVLSQTGRWRLRVDPTAELKEIRWNEGAPWEFWLEVAKTDTKQYELSGTLRRGAERLPLAAPTLLVQGGLVFWNDQVARLNDRGAFGWIIMLRDQGAIRVPFNQSAELLNELLKMPRLPFLDLPPELRFEEVTVAPRPRLKVKAQKQYWGAERLFGELSFSYDDHIIKHEQGTRGIYQEDKKRLLVRDSNAEAAALARLHRLGFRRPNYYYREDETLELGSRHLPRVVRALTQEGWHVEAEGKLYRQPGEFKIEVTSGIDWFELHGEVQFGDTVAKLPRLLEAARRGDNIVQLDDGSFGMLPEDWLKKYGVLAGLGKVKSDHLEFSRTQVGLLDALLATQEQATCDETFDKVRKELRRFDGIEPVDPPDSFTGTLRGYQREGLGWLEFLNRFKFGGCLADDMGLGKTVQVLALLDARKAEKKKPGPALVVVPRSLIFNWKQEAARFTPGLKVLDHTGMGRLKPGEHFQDYDMILTTYGTLRRDVIEFKDLTFDYCILDESQAIKNAGSQSAKAVRLLQANHRLAMSGTPVENHLGELWSLFEYLNPGMLGQASVFKLNGAAAKKPEPETQAILAKALRPFILRRTKEQVAKDLPQKTEQTVFCELEPDQRKMYDELRDYYRLSLLDKIQKEGINKAKIKILEALLRLRQCACHPGLIDKKMTREPSAKLDVLLPQLAEVFEEGHKALVFSQFTSMLSIVRHSLDKEKIPYEYLDGKTRNRQSRVERFQNDPDCKLFLISLKAGGLGLNLTAAEYVFLLDPWWNPAVEAQAVDRAHRIGQTRPVFAYRLIARDTVEEKVLELQKTKRALADAIITADNSLITSLDRQDLELLLS